MENCHDCNVKPGGVHLDGCDVERCSVCGGQRLQCNCEKHSKSFARWSGFWPGKPEANLMGIDLNTFYADEHNITLFIEPKTEKTKRNFMITYNGLCNNGKDVVYKSLIIIDELDLLKVEDILEKKSAAKVIRILNILELDKNGIVIL